MFVGVYSYYCSSCKIKLTFDFENVESFVETNIRFCCQKGCVSVCVKCSDEHGSECRKCKTRLFFNEENEVCSNTFQCVYCYRGFTCKQCHCCNKGLCED